MTAPLRVQINGQEVVVPQGIADELRETDGQILQLLEAAKAGQVTEELIDPSRIKRWFEVTERLANELERQQRGDPALET